MTSQVYSALEKFCDRVEESAARRARAAEASRKKTELESQLAAQLRQAEQLETRRAAQAEREEGLRRLRSKLRAGLQLTESDRARLHAAREMYQLGKELTGVRWNFSAEPGVVAGYLKSEQRRVLEPFRVGGAGGTQEGVWVAVMGAPPSSWGHLVVSRDLH